MPKGTNSIFLGVITVIFSYFGAEIAAIAASESENPAKAITTAIRSVVWRILIFYIGSVAILVTLLPWNSADLLKSPYVTMLEMVNIPAAAQIMNLVVLVSVLSCLNSALYTNSRMILSLAQKGQAPRALAKVSKSGVPARAVWISTAAAYVCAIFSFVSPDKLFLFLVNASGAIALIVYLAIAISHLRLRKKMNRADQPIKGMKMWLFPYLTYVTIAVITVIFLSMAFIDSMRSQFFLTLGLTAVVLLSYSFIKKTNNKRPDDQFSESENIAK
jgi:GABA permease